MAVITHLVGKLRHAATANEQASGRILNLHAQVCVTGSVLQP
jgi:hypothetical protein